MTLETLINIARAANVDWEQEFTSETETFKNTFNPRLIEKLLAEIITCRKMLSLVGRHRFLDEIALQYDKAREALDAELSPKE